MNNIITVDEMRPTTRYVRNHLGRDLICIEIGVKSGTNSLSLLKNLSIKNLYMIDPMEGYQDRNQEFMDKCMNTLRKNVLGMYDKAILIKKKSRDAINDIPNNIDFIYIDGNHSYECVKEDINLYYPKVKNGGVLGGHDYSSKMYDGVKRAVDEFINEYKYELYTKWTTFPTINKAETDWWIIKDIK